MSTRGRRFDLSWTDPAGRHFATTSGHSEYPDYLGFSKHTGASAREIVVCCMAHGDAFGAQPAAGQHLAGAIDSTELDGRYRDALWRGIDVDAAQVGRLIEWKNKVLVPATQASREHGAGGADDGF